MSSKQYVCGYNHCLHKGEKVDASAAVKIGARYYHWDCAEIKQQIKLCADTYIECVEDKTVYPIAMRVLNTLVFKNRVSVEFIISQIDKSKSFYADKPVYALYGLRKIYWMDIVQR